ncbi:RES family NAD+ phosphorylase [Halofilum ochraceum]|uniref:RES family NAD+ phosphorylase n=1 Tax=Halofilum ochraceum TaxID=1611323 RepID=UPI0008D9C21F|nr:RES family NAD+ phosphorylase [Halofilum ochraceum]
MWTPSALASEARPLRGDCWRAVEDQHSATTRRLTDTVAEQELLEDILEESKPPVPEPCAGLHYLLQTPFRYGAPPPNGSRFRARGDRRGVFYASVDIPAAMAELAFWRLMFFEASSAGVTPRNAAVLTVFSVPYDTRTGLDLTRPPLDHDQQLWTAPTDYSATQALAESAREAGVEVLRYTSVRDPRGRTNIAILGCEAFARRDPARQQTWRLWVDVNGVETRRAVGDEPALVFRRADFAHDPRLAD